MADGVTTRFVTREECQLRSDKQLQEGLSLIRGEMAEEKEERVAKLDDIRDAIDKLSKLTDTVLLKMDTPQVGIMSRLEALDRNQQAQATLLSDLQRIISPLVESRKRNDKWLDYALASFITYVLMRVLPYVGQLLQK